MTGLSKPPHLHRCKPSAMRTIRYRNFIRELLGSKYTRKCRFGHHTCYLKQERYRDFKTQDILNGLNRLRGSAAIHTKDQFKALRARLSHLFREQPISQMLVKVCLPFLKNAETFCSRCPGLVAFLGQSSRSLSSWPAPWGLHLCPSRCPRKSVERRMAMARVITQAGRWL